MTKRRLGTIQSSRPGYGLLCLKTAYMASHRAIFKGPMRGRPDNFHEMAISKNGTGSRARTYDLRFWRPPLYQLSYARIVRACRRSRRFLKASVRAVKRVCTALPSSAEVQASSRPFPVDSLTAHDQSDPWARYFWIGRIFQPAHLHPRAAHRRAPCARRDPSQTAGKLFLPLFSLRLDPASTYPWHRPGSSDRRRHSIGWTSFLR